MLCAAYLAAGPATRNQGKRDIEALFPATPFGPSGNVEVLAPMVLSSTASSYDNSSDTFTRNTKYYFWFFGSFVSLPIQSKDVHDGDDYLMTLLVDAMNANEPSEK